jgi:integrase
MVQSVNNKVGNKEEFFQTYNNGKAIALTYKKPNSNATFQFKDSRIAALPFCKSKNGVEVYHWGEITDDEGVKVEGAILVLRIIKTKKTFYARYKNKMSPSLGSWINNDTNKTIFKKGEAIVRIAKQRLVEYVRHQESRDLSVAHIADWTIEKYIDSKYEADREKYQIKNNSKKPVSYETRKTIKSDIKIKLNKKLKDINIEWLDDLIEYWETDKENPTNGKIGHKGKDSQRKSYTQINAMFNTCVRAGYIPKNPFDGETWRFANNDDEERELKTIDIDADIALKFIFVQAPGSMQGKILLASMMMGGFRNSEVYRNYSKNFRINQREIFIPAHISQKTNKSRTVPIENDYYWEKVEEYFQSPDYQNYKNEDGHFLPMQRKPAQKTIQRKGDKAAHATDAVKRPVWKAFKTNFNLEEAIRAYDFRHTFITNAARRLQLHEVVKYSGNSPEMVVNHYAKVDQEKDRHVFAEFQSSKVNKKDKIQIDNQMNSIDEIVIVNDKAIPISIQNHWFIFKSGKIMPNSRIKRIDFLKFVKFIHKLFDSGKISDKDTEIWLQMQ